MQYLLCTHGWTPTNYRGNQIAMHIRAHRSHDELLYRYCFYCKCIVFLELSNNSLSFPSVRSILVINASCYFFDQVPKQFPLVWISGEFPGCDAPLLNKAVCLLHQLIDFFQCTHSCVFLPVTRKQIQIQIVQNKDISIKTNFKLLEPPM